MAHGKIDGIWNKVKVLDNELAQAVITASMEMGVSPGDLVFWNMVCEEIRNLPYQSSRDFLNKLANEMNADQAIEGAGACRGMGGCRGMGACRGMGGCSMDSGDYDDLEKDGDLGAIGILTICTTYNLTPLDLALCWIQCPYVSVLRAKDVRQLKALADQINNEIAQRPIPPRPPKKVATDRAFTRKTAVTKAAKTITKAKKAPVRAKK